MPERASDGGSQWFCRCDCGGTTIVHRGNLKNGSTNSCKCIRNVQDGLSRAHPLWRRWSAIVDRCTKENDKDYKNYGARGITICERWLNFPSFLQDMESSFIEGTTIERIDNNKGYFPDNCEWATHKKQMRNQRITIFVDTPWGRKDQTTAAELAGVDPGRFRNRVRAGWNTERLFDPSNKGKMHRWSRRKKASDG